MIDDMPLLGAVTIVAVGLWTQTHSVHEFVVENYEKN